MVGGFGGISRGSGVFAEQKAAWGILPPPQKYGADSGLMELSAEKRPYSSKS